MTSFAEYKQLQENSLYSTPAEKAALVADKTKLMDAFFINYFGFLSLVSISYRGPIKAYETTEKKLYINNIGDENHDASLAIKLAFDEKLLPRNVVDDMTKLLVLIKNKTVETKNLDHNVVKAFLDHINYSSHKPSYKVLHVISEFHKGASTLQSLAHGFWKIAKTPGYEGISKEFVGLVKSGGYSQYFAKHPSNDQVAVPVVNAHTGQPVAHVHTQASPVAPAAKVVPVAVPKPAPAPIGKTKEFWIELFAARGASYAKVFGKYGVSQSDVNRSDFANAPPEFVTNISELTTSAEMYMYGSYRFIDNYLKKLVLETTSVIELDIIPNQVDIRSASAVREKILFLIKEVPEVKAHVDKIIRTTLATKIPAGTDRVYGLIRNLIPYVYDINSAANLPAVDVIRLAKMGTSMFSKSRVYDAIIGKYLPTWYYSVYNANTMSKAEFDIVPANIRAEIEKQDTLEWLNITVFDVSKVDALIKTINSMAGYNIAYNSTFKHMLSNGKIDQNTSSAIFSQILGSLDAGTWADNLGDTHAVDSFISNIKACTGGGSFLMVDFSAKYLPYITKHESEWTNAEHALSMLHIYNDDIFILEELDLNALFPNLQKRLSLLLNDSIANGRYLSRMGIISMFKFPELISQLIKTASFYGITDYSTVLSDLETQSYTAVSLTDANILFDKWYNYIVMGDTRTANKNVMQYFKNYISNYNELVTWANQYFSKITSINPKMITSLFNSMPEYEFSPQDINDISFDTLVNNITKTKNNPKLFEALSKKFMLVLENEQEYDDYYVTQQIKRLMANDENIMASFITDETADVEINHLIHRCKGLLNPGSKGGRSQGRYVVKDTYGSNLSIVTKILHSVGDRALKTNAGMEVVGKIATILQTPAKIEKEYRDSVITDVSTIFTNAEINPHTEAAFAQFDKSVQKLLAVNFASAQFAGFAVGEINAGGAVKPRMQLPAKGALKVLKLNMVGVPSSDVIDFRKFKKVPITLKTIQDLAKGAAASFKLEPQAVVEQPMNEIELEKLSVKYNYFNKYNHGGISIKINKVFNVAISSQNKGWGEYLTAHATDPTYETYKPQFHGTASMPASMILRYGFSVINESLARSAGIKYAGRMLGDGIYSSNVLDKVSQYINDDAPSGVSRKRGVVGYIFEMKAQGSTWGSTIGKDGADWSSAGGVKPREKFSTISPEWAWAGANTQLKIMRCFEITIIDKHEMMDLVKKHPDVLNDSVQYKSFMDYLVEARKVEIMNENKYATFTFMDGFIPTAKDTYTYYEDMTNTIPNAVVEESAYGITVTFVHNEDVYVKLLHGVDMEHNQEAKDLYFSLMGKK